MDAKQWLMQYLDNHRQEYAALSDRIWELAEVRFDVPQSAALLQDHLQETGFVVTPGIAGLASAFVGTYGTGAPVIGFLLEYDALPGMGQQADVPHRAPRMEGAGGHGCGHQMLGTGALAGAVAIKEYMQAHGLQGTLKVFGCPAEESGYGKAIMARAGVFLGLDALLTWHPMELTTLWGQSCLAIEQIQFHFTGTASHAGSAPEIGRSALDAAELMNIGVQFLREHMPGTARIHYAFLDVGGTAPNVVQPTASLDYFVRAAHREEASALAQRVIRIAEGAAMMTDTDVQVVRDCAAAEYIVNKTLGTAMYNNLRFVTPLDFTLEDERTVQPYFDSMPASMKTALLGRLKAAFPHLSQDEVEALAQKPLNPLLAPLTFPDTPLTASTDVGDASWFAPTAQVTIAFGPSGIPSHSWQWVALGKTPMAHRVLLAAGKTIAMTAYDILTDSDMLQKAKEEHARNMEGKTYEA